MKEIFDEYLKKYDKRNSKIKLKYYHSLRVMELCEILAKELKLSDRDVYLAKVLGLFHDIARFRQIKEYDTFNDLISFDHGDVGYNIFLKEIVPKLDLTMEEIKIVSKAIKYHNKYKIGRVNEKEELFCKIIRDADKLDILYIECDLSNVEYDDVEINDIVKRDFFEHKIINNSDIKTVPDRVVANLALLWDINYYYSYVIIKDYKYFKIYRARLNQEKFDVFFDEIDKFLGGI